MMPSGNGSTTGARPVPDGAVGDNSDPSLASNRWALRHYAPVAGRRPWLVWLHGLLGSGQDWQPILPWFSQWPQLTLDLPGHGDSARICVDNFAAVSTGLSATLAALGIENYILIGYSLGGRVALYHACLGQSQGLRALFVEGAHPGLTDALERRQRLTSDTAWVQRFCTQPMAQVLADWYRQPVFADLTPAERAALVDLRADNAGPPLAQMFAATSLARQPDLLPLVRQLRVPFGYLCGQRDTKFSALARSMHLPLTPIAGAGHNAHRAAPAAFARALRTLLDPFDE